MKLNSPFDYTIQPFLLSILVPAYNSIKGLTAILSAVGSCDVELLSSVLVVVSDDSPSPLLSSEHLANYRKLIPNLLYLWNSPSLGAVPNWNRLLNSTNSSYNWLLHHDECPVNLRTGLRKILSVLKLKKPSILILTIFKRRSISSTLPFSFFQRHTPYKLFLSFFLAFPKSLLLCNYIGPPSALIVSSALSYRFNSTFKWFVDVVAYVSLFVGVEKHSLYIVPASLLSVLSDQSFSGSITSSIKQNLFLIKRQEINFLRLIGLSVNCTHRFIGVLAFLYIKIFIFIPFMKSNQ